MKGDGFLESPIAAEALDTLTREELRKNVEVISLKAGAKALAFTSAITFPGVFLAVKQWPAFAKSTGTSGRVATAILPPVFAYAFVSEQTASRLAHPEAYERYRNRNDTTGIPLTQQVKDVLDENPAKFLVGAALPVVGGIFWWKGKDQSLTLSQRVMHTRVIGQFSVLAILSGVAMYHLLTDEDIHGHAHDHDHKK